MLTKILREVKNDVDFSDLDANDKKNLDNILNFYYAEKQPENLYITSEPPKGETVHFSDNEDEKQEEDFNSLIQEAITSYIRSSKLKETIRFNSLQNDEYDFNGKIAKVSVLNNQISVLDKDNNWIPFNEYLSINFPVVKSQNGSNKKPSGKTPTSSNNVNSIQSQLEKIKEEKQKLLNSLNQNSTSQTAFTRSKTPTGFPQKKLSN